ncbi:MAG: VWA domain-containing protein [Chthoniobacteraceae bacterium]
MNAIEVGHPWILALALPLALLLWLGQRRSLADLTRSGRVVCGIVRALVLTLLLLALARIHALLPGGKTGVMFVLDRSASVSAEARRSAEEFVATSFAAKPASALAGVVGFAERPALWLPPSELPKLPQAWPDLPDRNRTALAHALDFAGALLPAEAHRRVVLLSDGNDTSGGASDAARRLAASGVELFTVPLRNADAPEVLVERVEVPPQLKAGEPFDLSATVRSSVATTAKAKFYQNQFLIEQRDVSLNPGANLLTAANLRADGTFVTYEVEVIPAADTLVENNRAQATASLRGQPRVLLVDSDEARLRPLADALRREKIQADTRGVAGLPRSLEDLQQFDLLGLSDVSAFAVSREQMELYRRWVQDFGGGFLMLGGESSFGVGGYYRTPVEQLLPVQMEHQDRQDVPSVALLIVLDRSGSMSALVQGQTKMSLANQGAVFALNVLQPRDYFGVLAVDVRAHTVAPLAQHGNKDPIAQKIMSVTAGGGGIYIYTSMVEAFAQLRDMPARIKHLILFSDAADAEEKSAGEMGDGAPGSGTSLDLASAMLSSKITTSVVALGLETDRDTAFLRQLAERGNGRFYLTSDATTLPQIFSTETMKVAQSSLIEEPFQAVAARPSPILGGIDWAQSPLLLGYNATKPKPTADVLLATERGEPLLAVWRYGLGQSAAFTSDAKARWASEWLGWPGYGKFWAQVVRGVMRKSDRASFAIDTRETGDRLTLTIDAMKPDGSFRNQLPLTISALRPDGTSLALTPVQEAPGRYRAESELPEAGTTMFSVSSPDLPDGGATFGHTRSYPREFLDTTTNDELLRQLAASAGGAFDPLPADVWTAPAIAAVQRRELTDWFLIIALALIPVDIFLRRRAAVR